MKTYCIAALLLVTAGLTGCIGVSDWRTVRGSGNTLVETRDVSRFDRVSVSGAGELTILQGPEESLTIEADDNLLPLIHSDVANGHLSIGPKNVNLRPSQTIRYQLRVRSLGELHLSGSVQARAEGLKADRLSVSISGSGNMSVAHLDTKALTTQISGSGSMTAAGQADRQNIHISGSGNHRAPELKSSQAEAHISGSGHASLWVLESLNAHISGSGGVDYRGRPSVDSHVSGSGRVRHVGGGD